MTTPAAVDRDFIDLVAKDIRGHASVTEDQKQYLHSDEMADRRYDALVALKKDVEVQLATMKARWTHKQLELHSQGDDGSGWLKYKAEQIDWRVRAIKFLMAIEDEIAAVKEIRRQTHLLPADEDVLYLRGLIAQHRANTREDGYAPSEADSELWSVLY